MELLVAFLIGAAIAGFIFTALKKGSQVFQSSTGETAEPSIHQLRLEVLAKRPFEVEIKVAFTRKEDAEAARTLAQDIEDFLAERSKAEMKEG